MKIRLWTGNPQDISGRTRGDAPDFIAGLLNSDAGLDARDDSHYAGESSGLNVRRCEDSGIHTSVVTA